MEWPAYILAVLLIPLVFAAIYWLWGGEGITDEVIYVGIFILVTVLLREILRRSVHGNSVLLSRNQFPEVYAVVDDFSKKLDLKRRPDVYVANGDGALNAFAVESWGKSYIVLNSELFSDQGNSIRQGLAFVIGHELGHIRLKHTSIFYNIPLVPWMVFSTIPYLGDVLGLPYNIISRFREYSCDRIGAYLAPEGINGLLLLAAGRYVFQHVDLQSFLQQTRSRETRGRWMGIAELFSTHPFLANRVRNLYDRGFFSEVPASAQAQRNAER